MTETCMVNQIYYNTRKYW